MKKLHNLWLLLLLSLACRTAHAQAPAPAWQTAVAAVVGGAAGTGITAMAADGLGNVYLAGSFWGTVTLGNNTLTSAGGADIFVAKWSTASNSVLWAVRAGGTNTAPLAGNDYVHGLALSGGSVYLAGSFDSNVATFGSIALTNTSTYYTISNAGAGQYREAYVAKLTDVGGGGQFVWAKAFTGQYNDGASAVAVAGQAVYVAGAFRSSTLTLDGTTLASLDPSVGSNSRPTLFITKLLDTGAGASVAWAQRAGSTSGGTASTAVAALAVAGTSLYVAGTGSGAMQFGSAAIGLTTTGDDGFVAKLTDVGSAGSFGWVQPIGGPGGEYAQALVATGPTLYVGGYFIGATATLGSTTLTSADATSPVGFVAQLTDAGPTASFGWAKSAGGPGRTTVSALAWQGGALYVAGSFEDTAAFGSTSLTTRGNTDAWVARLPDTGSAFDWTQQAGGPGSDAATSLTLVGTTLYVAGNAAATASFGVLMPSPTAGTGFLATLAATPLATVSALGTGQPFYPNPVHTGAMLQLAPTTQATPAQVVVTNMRGQTVRRYPVLVPTTGTLALDFTGLAPGVYTLRVQDERGAATQKLVVE